MIKQDEIDLRFVANIVDNILIEVTKSGKVLFFNDKAACVFLGIRQGGLLSEYMDKDSFSIIKNNFNHAFYHQYPHHFNYVINDRFYLIYVYPLSATVWLSMVDITERRHQAHLLGVCNQRIDFSERKAMFGYWELDLPTKKFYWSDMMYAIFGLDSKNYINRRNLIREFIHPDDIYVYKNKLKELIKYDKDVSGQLRIILTNHSVKYCQFVASIIYKNGEPKIAGIFKDITDLVEEQIKLKNSKKVTDKENVNMTRFIAQASHDIRQQLQLMGMFISLLKKSYFSEYNQIVLDIDKSYNNLMIFLNNILDESKINFGKVAYNPHDFNLQQVLYEACGNYLEIAKDRNIILKYYLISAEINQDEFLLKRIVNNLIDNALRYAKSKVIVRNTNRSFWIVDDGCGINQDILNFIFDEYYQGDNENDKHYKGVGLGLNIVKKIASIINVKIKVKSRVNKYTIFKVSL